MAGIGMVWVSTSIASVGTILRDASADRPYPTRDYEQARRFASSERALWWLWTMRFQEAEDFTLLCLCFW
jgi:hypothetical protein